MKRDVVQELILVAHHVWLQKKIILDKQKADPIQIGLEIPAHYIIVLT